MSRSREAFSIHMPTMQEDGLLSKTTESAETEPIIEDEEAIKKKTQWRILTGRILIFLFLILGWELSTQFGWMNAYYWSSPTIILEKGWIAWSQGSLLDDIVFTSSATILGFLAGTLLGAVLGLSFWWSNVYASISEPYIVAFNAIPKLALAPVIIILLGIGFFSKVVLAFSMTVIVTALAAYSGVKHIDKDMEKLLFSLGAKRWQVFSKVVIPSAMPWILSSLRINIALALAGTIVGEFISSRQGVGRMILYAGQIMDTDLVWVGVVVLSILALLMYWAVGIIEKTLMKGIKSSQV
ncbi:ABC transporter permease [Evansella sp. AB-rgal1]|uniref:ABC transporter permease n=1 Tax=Evansella sp. AB-rgal1 TaxID=3242696 RepID=UPI00359ED56D